MIAAIVFLVLVFGIPAGIILYNNRAERQRRRSIRDALIAMFRREVEKHQNRN